MVRIIKRDKIVTCTWKRFEHSQIIILYYLKWLMRTVFSVTHVTIIKPTYLPTNLPISITSWINITDAVWITKSKYCKKHELYMFILLIHNRPYHKVSLIFNGDFLLVLRLALQMDQWNTSTHFSIHGFALHRILILFYDMCQHGKICILNKFLKLKKSSSIILSNLWLLLLSFLMIYICVLFWLSVDPPLPSIERNL